LIRIHAILGPDTSLRRWGRRGHAWHAGHILHGRRWRAHVHIHRAAACGRWSAAGIACLSITDAAEHSTTTQNGSSNDFQHPTNSKGEGPNTGNSRLGNDGACPIKLTDNGRSPIGPRGRDDKRPSNSNLSEGAVNCSRVTPRRASGDNARKHGIDPRSKRVAGERARSKKDR
jgi:hypothetical protein